MDWINKMYMITEKMKNQMHAKGIDSLDKIYMAISKFDSEGKNYVEKIHFENFLATIGIFLKSQELTELHKFLYTNENEGKVFFEAFTNILKVRQLLILV
jgi:Ca2+-binding EF-hand superfamily protein